MKVNTETVRNLLEREWENDVMPEMVLIALGAIEEYYTFQLKLRIRLLSIDAERGTPEFETIMEKIEYDERCQLGSVMRKVVLLNLVSKEVGLPPFYDGVVSDKDPYRVEVHRALMEYAPIFRNGWGILSVDYIGDKAFFTEITDDGVKNLHKQSLGG